MSRKQNHVNRMGLELPVAAFRAPAYLNSKHIDGPLLSWAGQLHWLTWTERIALRLGLRTIEQIAEKVWPSYEPWHV